MAQQNTLFRFSDHADRYPPAIYRKEIGKYFPFLSPKTMANLDSSGEGPTEVRRLSQKIVIYPTPSLLAWLDARMRAAETKVAPKKTEEVSVASDSSQPTKKSSRRRGRKTKTQERNERKAAEGKL